MSRLQKLKDRYERNEKIMFMVREGYPSKEISERLGVSLSMPSYIKKNYESIQEGLKNQIDTIERVISMFRSGKTVDEIAEVEGMTKQNISRMLNLEGLDRYDGGQYKTKLRRMEKIKELYSQGNSLEDLMEITGLSAVTIRNYGDEMGINIETRTAMENRKLQEEVVKLREEGWVQADIAGYLGISQSYVSSILLKNNLRSRQVPDYYYKRDSQIKSEYQKGKTIVELADKYQLNEANIRRILSDEGGV